MRDQTSPTNTDTAAATDTGAATGTSTSTSASTVPETSTTETGSHRIGYVLKMYPRFSETFIVSEILGREAAGAQIEIFSLRPPTDGRFHDSLARVQAPVTYVSRIRRAEELWERMRLAADVLGGIPPAATGLLLTASAEDAGQALQVAVEAQQRGITHLHAHFASVATTVARLAARLAGVTYSFTAHAKDLFHHCTDDDDVRAKAADAHHVVAISRYNVEHLRALGVAAESIKLVYNGLDLEAFSPEPAREARPGRAPLRIAAVGRLIEKKGFEVLIDACKLLHAAGIDLRCDIVGAGERAGALAAHITNLGLADVVVLTGPQPQPEVRRIVAAADVFAAPCVVGSDGNTDGLPTVVLEAMALGTPCVSTDVTGLIEAVRHDRTGLVVAQHDAVGLARAIDRIAADPELARRLIDAARELVTEQFDSRRQARALQDLLPGHLAEPACSAAEAPV